MTGRRRASDYGGGPPIATDVAMGVGWFALDDLPKLAFDHDDIVTRSHERLRGKVRYAPVGFELLQGVIVLPAIDCTDFAADANHELRRPRLVVSVSFFSMHVATTGELQFTVYVPRCVAPQ